MNTLLHAGARVQQMLESRRWKFCFIGGVANFRWDGFGLDVALGAMPFEASTIARSSNIELVPGAILRICSAEDLIVHKSFATRGRFPHSR